MELKSETKKAIKEVEIEESKQEKVTHSLWLERISFRLVLISIFSALAVVLGYILINLPNIELLTLIIFLSGFILGKRDGIIVGLLSSFIYCFFNPLGVSPLPLLTLQLIHYSLTGLIGALIRDFFQKKGISKEDDDLYQFSIMAIFGCIGALITLNFHIFYLFINFFSFFGALNEFYLFFLADIGFTVVHIIGNTLGFIFILPGLIQIIDKMLY